MIEQDPRIEKVVEFHKYEAKEQKKVEDRSTLLIVSVVVYTITMVLLTGIIGTYFKEILQQDRTLIYLSLIFVKILLFVCLYQIISSLLSIFKSIVKTKLPDRVFLYSVMNNFSKEIALIASIIFFYFGSTCKCILLNCTHCIYKITEDNDIGNLFQILDEKKKDTSLESTANNILKKTRSLIKVLPNPIPADDLSKISYAKIFSRLIKSKYDINDFENRVIFCVLAFMAIIFVKDLILFSLNYNVHRNYQSGRIAKNVERIELIRQMNARVNAAFDENIDIISQRLVDGISKNGSTILYFDLLEHFDEKTALKIFEYCANGDDDEEPKIITVDDIKALYFNTLIEQQHILKSLDQNVQTVDNFRNIINIAAYPTAIFLFLKSSNLFPQIDNVFSLALIGSLVLSTSYSFSDAIKGLILSLSFVFFVRPYETQDIVIFEQNVYKVNEINLVNTSFVDGAKNVTIPNAYIAVRPITNLRDKKIWEETFRYEFNLKKFESKREEFINKLSSLVKKFPTEYRKKPYFSKVTITKLGRLEAELIVGFNLDVSDLNVIRKRRNDFLFLLNGIFTDCELIPFSE